MRYAIFFEVFLSFAPAMLFSVSTWAQVLTPTARSGPINILFFGDSLTAGYGLSVSEAFPALVEKLAADAKEKVSVVNAGVSGDTTAGGLRRLAWALKNPVDIFVLELGANDGLRGLDLNLSSQNLREIIARTRKKYPLVTVLLVGMRLPTSYGADFNEKFSSMYGEIAKDTSSELLPFLLEGIAMDPAFSLPDRIHPNAEGHKKVAETVWKSLEPLIKKKVMFG